MNGKPLVYLDSAATAQKPTVVLKALSDYYLKQNANIHRGVYRLSQESTVAFEKARVVVQQFIGARYAHEIVFTAGTTASINLVASSFGKKFVNKGDELLVSEMEHHSNILPWQVLCQERGAVLKVIPLKDKGELDKGELDLEAFKKLLGPKTKLLALTQVSNTLGTVNPVTEMIALAHAAGAAVLIDGAQAVPHMKVNVVAMDCDFYCFSGHKLYGPTGIGVLYGKEKWLKELPPYQVGGGTIKTVRFSGTEYAELPLKFEAGTPHIEGGIGLGVAIDYLNSVGLDLAGAYEQELLRYATEKLSAIGGLRIIGAAAYKAAVISFVVDGLHALDIGTILDQQGIAVRTGHHCTQPLMERFGISGTVRASFAFYNTFEEVDKLVDGVIKALKMLRS